MWGLAEAESSASKFWDVARRGMTAYAAFAKAIGLNKTSGGAWDARLAHLRGFGLIVVKPDEIGLSELGLDLVQDFDPDKRLAARRKALLTLKSYRELVGDYDQTKLPETDNIASKLEFEYGKSSDFAKQAAAGFVASLSHAQMLDGSNVVHKDGVVAGQAAPKGQAAARPSLGEGTTVEEPTEDQIDQEIDDAFDHVDDPDLEEPPFVDPSVGAGAATVALSLSLDLSRYPASEVITILRALGIAGRD